MNTRSIELEHISAGDVIYITACSQCASTAKIVLEGDLDSKIELTKNSGECKLTRLEGPYATSKKGDGKVFLQIEIPNDDKMKVIKNIFIMSDINGKEQGINFSFNIEDASDNDFNDYLINVVTWHRKG